MGWRVSLTFVYAGVLGALMAFDNSTGLSDALWLIAWLAAPVVGFLVGRWWVVFAVLGAIAGRTIGWDPGEHDGAPALWSPYVVSTILLLGLPLLAGAACSYVRRGRRQPLVDRGG